ncbi:hypothetical protein AKJ09_01731 [Labilithrix luteola]|uniref:Uncharacterized protein n=1 Tax=Labilithrix luteola TaxID=1391654 RepID=A0A0K1PNH6_9BACT|nr:hypothetical protein AKJ09_01731 [Labilithrix luteola]
MNCTNKYSIGGTVTGLAGTVYLQNNAGNDLMLNANGTFAFSTPLSSGATYAVTVRTQPSTPKQVCTLSNQTGTVATSHITNIALNCVTSAYKVKATVSGLAAGASVVLQNNNADDLSITSNGAFTFATSVPSGQTYSVTVKTPPTSPSQTCTVTNGTGTISAADISNVTVACVTDKFTVGGSVAGLSGAGLVLQNNLGDNLSVNAPGGSFTFATKVTSGQPYSVTVKTQPTNPSQKCTVSAGTGTVTKGNVVTVTVNCVSMYTVGGAVSGLSGTGLVLQNNLGDDLTVNGDNSFAFATPMASGQPYSVTVKTQPTNPDQTCTVDNGSGTVGGNVTNVTVTCVTN